MKKKNVNKVLGSFNLVSQSGYDVSVVCERTEDFLVKYSKKIVERIPQVAISVSMRAVEDVDGDWHVQQGKAVDPRHDIADVSKFHNLELEEDVEAAIREWLEEVFRKMQFGKL